MMFKQNDVIDKLKDDLIEKMDASQKLLLVLQLQLFWVLLLW